MYTPRKGLGEKMAKGVLFSAKLLVYNGKLTRHHFEKWCLVVSCGVLFAG